MSTPRECQCLRLASPVIDARRVIDAFSILSGFIALGATLGWAAAMLARLADRRSVPVADWVVHGAGFLGLLGMAIGIAYLLGW